MRKKRYVLLPSDGMTVPESNPHQKEFFQSLHYRVGEVHTLSTMAGGIIAGDGTTATMTVGGTMEITVLDSIDEHKAKLIEIAPEDLAAFRGAHPSARLEPEVFYRPALIRYEVAAAALDLVAITVTSSQDGAPVPDAMVVAFTNFANRLGAQGTTDAQGRVSLALGSGPHQIERLYVYPKRQFWPALQRNLTLSNGSNIALLPIDLSYVDCVRHYYGNARLDSGMGLTVGVIDSGVATNHPDLTVEGGKNTVMGEPPADYGDNGTEGHGTHVAGIIAAHGAAPLGIRGVAPGVALRSYRVFGKGQKGASNYSITKAIEAAVADGCDLINMSLGGGPPDTVVAEAIASAYQAGVVIFAATGNDHRNPVSFPARNDFCQAVAAMGRKGTFPVGTEPEGSILSPFGTDPNNFVADFSNIGPETDLIGPGVGVISTVPGGYAVMSGTSMATPAETGAAARLLSSMPHILTMPRDQNRAAEMVKAISAACKLPGFGAVYEGRGMIILQPGL